MCFYVKLAVENTDNELKLVFNTVTKTNTKFSKLECFMDASSHGILAVLIIVGAPGKNVYHNICQHVLGLINSS